MVILNGDEESGGGPMVSIVEFMRCYKERISRLRFGARLVNVFLTWGVPLGMVELFLLGGFRPSNAKDWLESAAYVLLGGLLSSIPFALMEHAYYKRKLSRAQSDKMPN